MKRLSAILAVVFLLLAGCSAQADEHQSQPGLEAESNVPLEGTAASQQVDVAAQAQSEDNPPKAEQEQQQVGDNEPLYIRLTFAGGEALVSLEDNEAARGWYAQLPMTQTFEDFHDQEKICRIPEPISTGDMEIGNVPVVGDISLYIPWNTLVFYYDEYDGNDSSVPIGHVESGLDLLRAAGDEYIVTMEAVDASDVLVGSAATQPEQAETPSEDAEPQTTDITMTVGDTVITATLDNSETSREFLATLPRTISMSRYADREYYGRIEAISTNGEEIPDFSNGDVTLYVPGPSFAIFFGNEDQSSLSGLIRMGRITSDLSEIDALGDSVEILIEITK